MEPMAIPPKEESVMPRREIGEDERKMILELGRDIMSTIRAFQVKKKTFIATPVIFGATDYVIKLYKRRLEAIGNDFFFLEKTVKDSGIEIAEPYYTDRDEKPIGEILTKK